MPASWFCIVAACGFVACQWANAKEMLVPRRRCCCFSLDIHTFHVVTTRGLSLDVSAVGTDLYHFVARCFVFSAFIFRLCM